MITKFNRFSNHKPFVIKENNYWQKLLKENVEYYYQITRISKAKSKLVFDETGSVGFEIGCFLKPEKNKFEFVCVSTTSNVFLHRNASWAIEEKYFLNDLHLPYSLDDEILEHANANRKCLEDFILNKLGIKNFNELTHEHYDNLNIVF